jgi:hypothetical protein
VTTRGTNLAWAAIGAHLSGDDRKVEYANKFFQAMGQVRKVGDRVPLFFDPVTKVLVTAETLLRAVKRVLATESGTNAAMPTASLDQTDPE